MNSILTAVLCLSLFTVGHAFIQKMTLEVDTGESLDGDSFACKSIFRSKVPDAESLHIGNITRVCFHGFWLQYSQKNFVGKPSYSFNLEEYCMNRTDFPFLSFRYGGLQSTSIDSITLYSNSSWEGEETIVTLPAHAGIPSGSSVVLTGKSKWTIFSGSNFEGESKCAGEFTSSDWEMDYWFDVGVNFGLKSVGSVIKGCDPDVIADIQARARRGEKFY